jgi:DNA helicase-2/ATP-dependent DNA helicase PcrA
MNPIPPDPDAALNPEQRAAVEAPDGPVLVIAAAGTGKTRTLTHRVASLVRRGVDPGRMLLLTFTNRAAREMLDRARRLVGESVGGIWGGTFHHLCNRILRRYAVRIGLENAYTILDSDDSSKLMKVCAGEMGLRSDKMHPKPDIILHLHSLARNSLRDLSGIVRDHFSGDPPEAPARIVEQCALYETHKRALRALDFDDLLTEGIRLFEEHPDILRRYQDQFEHILVDEYQDTNPVQARLVDLLAGTRRNLLVVGDDFQSVYSWRGADYRNFLTFPQRYPDVRIYKLETNYRSVPGVLDVANACIAGNPEQFQKTLRAVRPAGRRPVRVELRDGGQQAAYIIEQIHLLRREGVPAREIAVLYRAHYHAMEMELELTRARLPYSITSGVRFFEQAHIKDALALVRLMHNPADELAFTRLMGLLPRVGERTAARIWRTLGGRAPLRNRAHAETLSGALPAGARAMWARIASAIEPPSGGVSGEGPAPAAVLRQFTDAFYRDYAEAAFDEFASRHEDLEALAAYATRFETAAELLSEVALLTNVDGAQNREGADASESILLSTIHQAKGLEWHTVFLLWVSDGLFPAARSLESAGGEAEERRLFYVAVTRAKDRLYLCHPRWRRTRDGGVISYLPSRFLREIPAALMDHEKADAWTNSNRWS